MSIEHNSLIVRRYVEEVFNEGNLALVDDLVDPNFVDYDAPPGLPPGPEGARQAFALLHSAFPDHHHTVEDLIAGADKVVARWTLEGTHTGALFGIPPTGKQVKVKGISIYRVADGKIVEEWVSNDRLGLMQQLGVIPTK